MTLDLLNIFSKNIQSLNLFKIIPVGIDLFYEYGRTGSPDEANIRFS